MAYTLSIAAGVIILLAMAIIKKNKVGYQREIPTPVATDAAEAVDSFNA